MYYDHEPGSITVSVTFHHLSLARARFVYSTPFFNVHFNIIILVLYETEEMSYTIILRHSRAVKCVADASTENSVLCPVVSS
jgi:hypothetical protein